MLNIIKNIQRAYQIYRIISPLFDIQKTSLYRMLYWQTHYSEIPKDEYLCLIAEGWLIKTDGGIGYTWSDEAIKISNLFK